MRMISMSLVKDGMPDVKAAQIKSTEENIQKSSFNEELESSIKRDNSSIKDDKKVGKDKSQDKEKSISLKDKKVSNSAKQVVLPKKEVESEKTAIISGKKDLLDKKLPEVKSVKNPQPLLKKNSKDKDKSENSATDTLVTGLNPAVDVKKMAEVNNKLTTENEKDSDKKTSVQKSESLEIKNSKVIEPDKLQLVKVINAESKVSDKKNKSEKSDNKIKVTDFRTKLKDAENKSINKNSDSNQKDTKVNHIKTEQPENSEASSDKSITIGSNELSAEGDTGKNQAPVVKEASQLIKQQLKDFGNSEIVKQSRFILKDNNIGEIKLILKPESLGEVKINLNLKQNSLAGQIVVENNSVKEIFQENMSSLTKALEEQGYDSAELKLSLSDKGQKDQRDKRENKQYFSDRLKKIDENTVRVGTTVQGINLTA